MKSIHLIVVGKLKDNKLEEIENSYLKRISVPNIKIHELKSSSENKTLEGKEIIKKLDEIKNHGACFTCLLTENGKQYDSPDFANFIFNKLESFQHLALIIGGAEGFSQDVKETVNSQLSLSKLTFPHKIARILIIEQLYRAMTIKQGHPYHN